MRCKGIATLWALLLPFAHFLKSQVREAQEFHRVVASANSSWQDLEGAFDRLLRSVPVPDNGTRPWSTLPAILAAQPDSGETLRLDLIRALTRESEWARLQSSLTEEFTDYDGNLTAAVTSLRDPHSLDVLFERVDSGDMALTALATFGDPALRRAFKMLNANTNDDVRHSALLLLLAKIAQPDNFAKLKDPSLKAQLLRTLNRNLYR